mgnify:CR=1 FL=1
MRARSLAAFAVLLAASLCAAPRARAQERLVPADIEIELRVSREADLDLASVRRYLAENPEKLAEFRSCYTTYRLRGFYEKHKDRIFFAVKKLNEMFGAESSKTNQTLAAVCPPAAALKKGFDAIKDTCEITKVFFWNPARDAALLAQYRKARSGYKLDNAENMDAAYDVVHYGGINDRLRDIKENVVKKKLRRDGKTEAEIAAMGKEIDRLAQNCLKQSLERSYQEEKLEAEFARVGGSAEARRKELIAELLRAVDVVVKVTLWDDVTGERVEGGEVKVAGAKARNLPSGTTDSDGRVLLRMPLREITSGFELVAGKRGQYRANRLKLTRHARTVSMGMSPVIGRLTGKVTAAEDGKPVVGAVVAVGRRTAKTAADGSYAVEKAPSDAARPVTVTAEGFAPGSRRVAIPAGGEASADFKLSRKALEARLVVVDSESGKGINGVKLPFPAVEKKSDEDGTQLRWPAGTRSVLEIRRRGYLPARREITDADAGKTVTLKLTPLLFEATGTVTDAHGAPMEGAAVTVLWETGLEEATTDAKGSWRMKGLRGNWVHATCRKDGYVRAGAEERFEVDPASGKAPLIRLDIVRLAKARCRIEFLFPTNGAVVAAGEKLTVRAISDVEGFKPKELEVQLRLDGREVTKCRREGAEILAEVGALEPGRHALELRVKYSSVNPGSLNRRARAEFTVGSPPQLAYFNVEKSYCENPKPGQRLLVACFTDAGKGVDLNHVSLRLDGRVVRPQLMEVYASRDGKKTREYKVAYAPPVPLSAGRHVALLSVRDRDGLQMRFSRAFVITSGGEEKPSKLSPEATAMLAAAGKYYNLLYRHRRLAAEESRIVRENPPQDRKIYVPKGKKPGKYRVKEAELTLYHEGEGAVHPGPNFDPEEVVSDGKYYWKVPGKTPTAVEEAHAATVAAEKAAGAARQEFFKAGKAWERWHERDMSAAEADFRKASGEFNKWLMALMKSDRDRFKTVYKKFNAESDRQMEAMMAANGPYYKFCKVPRQYEVDDGGRKVKLSMTAYAHEKRVLMKACSRGEPPPDFVEKMTALERKRAELSEAAARAKRACAEFNRSLMR